MRRTNSRPAFCHCLESAFHLCFHPLFRAALYFALLSRLLASVFLTVFFFILASRIYLSQGNFPECFIFLFFASNVSDAKILFSVFHSLVSFSDRAERDLNMAGSTFFIVTSSIMGKMASSFSPCFLLLVRLNKLKSAGPGHRLRTPPPIPTPT